MLALVPVIAIPIAAACIGRSYPPVEALKFSALLFFSGIVFLSVGLLYSCVLPGDVSAGGASAMSVYLAFNSQDYFYSWLPRLNVSRFMSGFDFLDLRTGFLTGWPWAGVLTSLSIAGVLIWPNADGSLAGVLGGLSSSSHEAGREKYVRDACSWQELRRVTLQRPPISDATRGARREHAAGSDGHFPTRRRHSRVTDALFF